MLPRKNRHDEEEIVAIALAIIWLTLAITIVVMTGYYLKAPWNVYAILWMALGLTSSLMRNA